MKTDCSSASPAGLEGDAGHVSGRQFCMLLAHILAANAPPQFIARQNVSISVKRQGNSTQMGNHMSE